MDLIDSNTYIRLRSTPSSRGAALEQCLKEAGLEESPNAFKGAATRLEIARY